MFCIDYLLLFYTYHFSLRKILKLKKNLDLNKQTREKKLIIIADTDPILQLAFDFIRLFFDELTKLFVLCDRMTTRNFSILSATRRPSNKPRLMG